MSFDFTKTALAPEINQGAITGNKWVRFLDTIVLAQRYHLLHSDLTTPYEAISKSHDEKIKISTAIHSKVVFDMFLIRSWYYLQYGYRYEIDSKSSWNLSHQVCNHGHTWNSKTYVSFTVLQHLETLKTLSQTSIILCPPPSDAPHVWRGPLSLDATNEWRQYPRCIPIHAISPWLKWWIISSMCINVPWNCMVSENWNVSKLLMILVLIQGSIVPQMFGPVADHISSIWGGCSPFIK